MLLRNTYLALLAFLFVANAQAQKAYPYRTTWYLGGITTKTGEEVGGELQFDWETNSLKLKKEETIKTFSPSNVEKFEFFDPQWKAQRHFVSLPFLAKKRRYASPIFFEVIYEGKVSVLMRENDVEMVGLVKFKNMMRTPSECYLHTQGSTPVRFDGRSKSLYELLPNHQAKLDSFIARNRLNPYLLRDLLLIVEHYNSLELATL